MGLPSVFSAALFTVTLFEMHGLYDCARQYGCIFDDQEFTYNGNSIFGNAIGSVILNSTQQLNEILRVATDHTSAVMGNFPLNTVGEFTAFYRYYVRQRDLNSQQSFQQIYANYRPGYRSIESIYSLAANILFNVVHDLTDDIPSIKYSVFFVTADNTVSPDTIASAREATHFVYNFHHNHVAAIIRFTLRIDGNDRLGHIVMDIGLGLNAFIIMADGQHPHEGSFFYLESARMITFTMIGQNKQFLLGQINNGQNILYYLGLAFCSLRDTTTKVNLLNKKQFFLSRDRDGYPLSEVSVTFPATDFQMIIYDITGEHNETVSVPFDDLIQLSADNEEYDGHIRAVYRAVRQTMMLYGNTLLMRLYAVGTASNNTSFMQSFLTANQ